MNRITYKTIPQYVQPIKQFRSTMNISGTSWSGVWISLPLPRLCLYKKSFYITRLRCLEKQSLRFLVRTFMVELEKV